MPLKQVKFTVDFVVNVEDITDEDIRESPDFIDQKYLEKGRRERRLLYALLENKEAFQKYANFTFISLLRDMERLLGEKYPVDGSYEALIDHLKPAVSALSEEDKEFIEKDMKDGTFGDDALFFSAFNLDIPRIPEL